MEFNENMNFKQFVIATNDGRYVAATTEENSGGYHLVDSHNNAALFSKKVAEGVCADCRFHIEEEVTFEIKPIYFDVLSPDGFSISFDQVYATRAEAFKAQKEWAKRFEIQGYYSSVNGRIELKYLREECYLIMKVYEPEEEEITTNEKAF